MGISTVRRLETFFSISQEGSSNPFPFLSLQNRNQLVVDSNISLICLYIYFQWRERIGNPSSATDALSMSYLDIISCGPAIRLCQYRSQSS